LVTGPPAIGKTTLMLQLTEKLSDLSVAGFYTKEIRKGGQRVGFQISTFDGREKVLAHVAIRSVYRVSKYGVDIDAMEEIIHHLKKCNSHPNVWLIDEIGKMESYSSIFRKFIGEIMDYPQPVVATISQTAGGWIEIIRNRFDIKIMVLNVMNRDLQVNRIEKDLRDLLLYSQDRDN
jgi:nucleoside-triphosphatase